MGICPWVWDGEAGPVVGCVYLEGGLGDLAAGPVVEVVCGGFGSPEVVAADLPLVS